MTGPKGTRRQLVPAPTPLPTPRLVLGGTLIEVLKARGARWVLEEQERALRAQTERNDAVVDWETSLRKLEHADKIADLEVKKIREEHAELDREARRRSELFELELAAEKARLVADAKEHEVRSKQYDKALNPPKELPAPDPFRVRMEKIKDYQKHEQDIEDEWQRIVTEAGGEEHVSASARNAHRLLRDQLHIELDKELNTED